MNKALVAFKNDELFVDSRTIAEGALLDHESVIRMINKHEEKLERLGKLRFSDFKSGNSQGGRPSKFVCLNEQQATFLLTLLKNTDIVVEFKLNLTTEFYRMREFILEKKTAEWKEARLTGKKARRAETDVIMEKLIPLAIEQGSKNPEKLYTVYSKLVNETLGIKAGQRDKLPLRYIEVIKAMEILIENIIESEVDKGTHYKQIFQVCKAKCQILKELSFLPTLNLIA